MSCIATLKAKGLKMTPQRRLIVDIIHDADAHLTAEAIIEYVQSKMPGVHKSTIYRTLDLLENAGCVFKSDLGDQTIYHHSDGGHHHHLVCTECGRTIDLDDDLLAPTEQLLMDKYGFSVDLKHVIINGLCDQCRKNTNNKNK